MWWNRELGGFLIAFLMLASFIFLIIKRKNADKGDRYFTIAIGILSLIEVYSTIQRYFDDTYNSSLLYVIGVNLIVFLLFFFYFQTILFSRKLKLINIILIILFLLNYLISAVADDYFFSRFPFVSYFVEVVLLTCSIYLVMSQTFNSDKILDLGNYFPFWVCISLLIIYLGVLPLLIISYTAASKMNLNIFFAILFLVNAVGYSILLYGIMKAKRET